MSPAGPERVGRRLYRRLLRAYPRELTTAWGEEMLEVFTDLTTEAARRGPFALARLWARALLDLAVHAAGARLERRTSARPAHAPSTRKEQRMESFLLDVRNGFRALRKQPGFATLAILTLALGIGANAAVFSVMDGVLLRSLPFPEAGELVHLMEAGEQSEALWPSYQNFTDWRDRSAGFETMAALTFPEPVTVLGLPEPARAKAVGVTRGFFELLGVRPLHGRTFGAWEHQAGAAPVVVVSHEFWQRRLGGAKDLSSSGLEVRGGSYAVVGVAPPGFRLLGEGDLWYPLEATGQQSVRGAHWLRVVGRLRDGVTVEAADRDLDRIAAWILEAHPGETEAAGVHVKRLQEVVSGNVRKPLLILMVSALLVLLVGCTNLSSMLLGRTARRQGELSVRAALGASRGRIVRQLLGEGVALAALGAVGGVALAFATVKALIVLAPASLPRLDEVGMSWRVLLFSAGLALGAVLLFSLAPAVWSSGRGSAERLRRTGRGASASSPVWRTLMALEAALAVTLLVGAGLLLRSFANILTADTGFTVDGVAVAEVSLPTSRYAGEEETARFFQRVLGEIEGLPGVEHAGLVTWLPMAAGNYVGPFELEDGRRSEGVVGYRVASPGYFRALDLRLQEGRLFGEDPGAGAHETVINRSMADAYWPGESPLGRRIRAPGMDAHGERWLTVVGVVAEARRWSLPAGSQPEYYVHYAQRPYHAGRNAFLVAGVAGRPESVLPALRSRVWSVDPDVPVRVSTLAAELGKDVSDRRFALLLLGFFAVLALLLTGVGIYGVVSFVVAAQAREIGIRMTLGATRSGLRGWVVGGAVVSVGAGVVAGLGAALAVSRLLASLLYEVSATDTLTLSAAASLVLGTALLASWLPAERISRIDPAAVMRRS